MDPQTVHHIYRTLQGQSPLSGRSIHPSAPIIQPGENPFVAINNELEAHWYPSFVGRDFAIQCYVLIGIFVFEIIASLASIGFTLLHSRNGRKVWLFRHIVRREGTYITCNLSFVIPVPFAIFAAVLVAYTWVHLDIFTNHASQATIGYWRTLVWIPIMLQAWFWSFANFYSALLSSNLWQTSALPRPGIINVIHFGGPIILIAAVTIPAIYSSVAWGKAFGMYEQMHVFLPHAITQYDLSQQVDFSSIQFILQVTNIMVGHLEDWSHYYLVCKIMWALVCLVMFLVNVPFGYHLYRLLTRQIGTLSGQVRADSAISTQPTTPRPELQPLFQSLSQAGSFSPDLKEITYPPTPSPPISQGQFTVSIPTEEKTSSQGATGPVPREAEQRQRRLETFVRLKKTMTVTIVVFLINAVVYFVDCVFVAIDRENLYATKGELYTAVFMVLWLNATITGACVVFWTFYAFSQYRSGISLQSPVWSVQRTSDRRTSVLPWSLENKMSSSRGGGGVFTTRLRSSSTVNELDESPKVVNLRSDESHVLPELGIRDSQTIDVFETTNPLPVEAERNVWADSRISLAGGQAESLIDKQMDFGPSGHPFTTHDGQFPALYYGYDQNASDMVVGPQSGNRYSVYGVATSPSPDGGIDEGNGAAATIEPESPFFANPAETTAPTSDTAPAPGRTHHNVPMVIVVPSSAPNSRLSHGSGYYSSE